MMATVTGADFIQNGVALLQAVFYRGHGRGTEGTREYRSLPESQLPQFSSLEDFWAKMGAFPKPGGEEPEKCFSNLTHACQLLLVLPHSTADLERFFSVIGKVDTNFLVIGTGNQSTKPLLLPFR